MTNIGLDVSKETGAATLRMAKDEDDAISYRQTS